MKNTSMITRCGWGILLAAIPTLLFGCGGKSPAPRRAGDWEPPWEVRMESPLDTLEMVAAAAGDVSPPDSGTVGGLPVPQVVETPPVEPSSRPDAQEFTPGWRVQLFASSGMVNADEFAGRARQLFSEAVYVEYEPPLYKVRVGDFLTKPAAKQMAARAQAEGYDVWVVETMVVRPER